MNEQNEKRPRRQSDFMMFLGEYWALLKKVFLLTKRNRGQTIAEFILAYVFLALLLIMRSLLDRTYKPAYQVPAFNPHQSLLINSTRANVTYFYPSRIFLLLFYFDDCKRKCLDNTCTQTIMSNVMTKLQTNVPGFSNTRRQTFLLWFIKIDSALLVAPIPNPTLSSLTSTTLESIFAYVVFTNVPTTCGINTAMPDQVQYTLRMQE